MTATPQDTASQDTASTQPGAAFPDTGTPAADLLAKIRADRPGDIDWKHGKAFSLVYNVDDPELDGLLCEVAHEFLHENALNPLRYKTLLAMEMEVIAAATARSNGVVPWKLKPSASLPAAWAARASCAVPSKV